MKFRDVKFDDASILFNFCSILSNKRCIFYFNDMTRLIRTLSMTPSVPVLTGFDCIFLTCFQYSIILCPKISQGSNSLSYAFSDPTVNRKKTEKERLKRIAQGQRSFLWHEQDCSLSDPAVTSFPYFKIIFRFYNDLSYLRIPPRPPPPLPPRANTKLLQLFLSRE